MYTLHNLKKTTHAFCKRKNKKQIRGLKISYAELLLKTCTRFWKTDEITVLPTRGSNGLRGHSDFFPGFLPPHCYSSRFVFATFFISLFHRVMNVHSGRSRLARTQSFRIDITYRFMMYFPSNPRQSFFTSRPYLAQITRTHVNFGVSLYDLERVKK